MMRAALLAIVLVAACGGSAEDVARRSTGAAAFGVDVVDRVFAEAIDVAGDRCIEQAREAGTGLDGWDACMKPYEDGLDILETAAAATQEAEDVRNGIVAGDFRAVLSESLSALCVAVERVEALGADVPDVVFELVGSCGGEE